MKRLQSPLWLGVCVVFSLVGLMLVAAGATPRRVAAECGADAAAAECKAVGTIPPIVINKAATVEFLPISGSEPKYEPEKWNDCPNGCNGSEEDPESLPDCYWMTSGTQNDPK